MQCRQKRYDVFINLLWIFTTTLIFHVTCNFCTVIWALPMTGLRKITGIINDLQEAISTSRVTWPSLKLNPKKLSMDVENGILQKNKRLSSSGDLIEWKGHDFLFLFDLIACTCGRASTFRVLSYTSSRFHLILFYLYSYLDQCGEPVSAPDDDSQNRDHGDLYKDPLAARATPRPQGLLPALRGRVHRHHLPRLRLQELVLGWQGDRV